MNRRAFLSLIGAAGAAALCRPRAMASQPSQPRPPNIIVILADDMGYADLHCYGGADARTPNLDRLAAEGIRLTDGYVASPVCSPSRAGLLSGRYPQRFGHEFNPRVRRGLLAQAGIPLSEKTMGDYLRSAGYATACIGKGHLGGGPDHHPLKRGFDEYFGFLASTHSYINEGINLRNPILRGNEPVDERDYLTDAFTREACACIERNRARPFFMYLAYSAVHGPLHRPPEKYMSRFSHVKDNFDRWMCAMVAALDDGVGRIVQTLARLHLEQDTILFFLSDNGAPVEGTNHRNAPFRGGKLQVLEGGIRVPFIVKWKDHLPAGSVYRQPVISLDIAATANVLAGVPHFNAGLDGADLIPFLSGQRGDGPHEALCWRIGEERAIRRGDWKLIDASDGHAHLYNLARDPSERDNLAGRMPQVQARLEADLRRWNETLVPPLWIPVGPAGRELPNAD